MSESSNNAMNPDTTSQDNGGQVPPLLVPPEGVSWVDMEDDLSPQYCPNTPDGDPSGRTPPQSPSTVQREDTEATAPVAAPVADCDYFIEDPQGLLDYY